MGSQRDCTRILGLGGIATPCDHAVRFVGTHFDKTYQEVAIGAA
jgi:hypothetical protein